jgi:hypothetical protein
MERRVAYLEAVGRSAEALKHALEARRRAWLAFYRAGGAEARRTATCILDQASENVEDRKRDLIRIARYGADGEPGRAGAL